MLFILRMEKKVNATHKNMCELFISNPRQFPFISYPFKIGPDYPDRDPVL